VPVLGAQDLVDDIAVAGQQYQAFRVLVQAADREDALLVANEVHDVPLDRAFGGAGDADRLVQGDVDVAALARLGCTGIQRLPVDPDLVALAHHRADPGRLAVDGHPALGDRAIGLAARTEAGSGDVFVEADGFFGHGGIIRWPGHLRRARRSGVQQVASCTWSRPDRLATYMAPSARRSRAAASASLAWSEATPMLAVSTRPSSRSPLPCAARRPRKASMRCTAACAPTPGNSTRNSPPPMRAASTGPRTAPRRASAAAMSTRSPASWPYSSLIDLKWSMSTNATLSGAPCCRARANSSSSRRNPARRFGSPVRESVSASCCISSRWRRSRPRRRLRA